MSFKSLSRVEYSGPATIDNINTGSLQRIADATEKIAANYDDLLRAKKSAEESRDYWRSRAQRLELSMRSLRGYVTRLKKRLPPLGVKP